MMMFFVHTEVFSYTSYEPPESMILCDHHRWGTSFLNETICIHFSAKKKQIWFLQRWLFLSFETPKQPPNSFFFFNLNSIIMYGCLLYDIWRHLSCFCLFFFSSWFLYYKCVTGLLFCTNTIFVSYE